MDIENSLDDSLVDLCGNPEKTHPVQGDEPGEA
jgi:hypothetical protein